MNPFRLVIKSFRHYFPAHLAVAAGIALSTAIIIGGLIVGDSLTYSLLETARFGTGNMTHLVRAGDRIFTVDLVRRMGERQVKTAPALRTEGIASAEGGGNRLNRIQVWGLDSGFNVVAGSIPGLDSLAEDECIISENVALRLGLKEGDWFLLRIKKVSQVPANAPFVSDRDQTVTARMKVRRIAGREEMGRFNLKISQTAPYNVFLPLNELHRRMDLENRCNIALISGEKVSVAQLERSLQENWTSGDAGLEITYFKESDVWKISTRRVFINAAISSHIKSVLPEAEPVLTYFANSMRSGTALNPYSFVSTVEDGAMPGNGILLTDWLAADLNVQPGDTVYMRYFVIGPLRELKEEGRAFIVNQIIPQPGRPVGPALAPFIPGLSDAGSCSEWEAGVPVDLEAIRDRDEDYWNQYRGTPKAFLSLETAEEMWQNRFGNHTSFWIGTDQLPPDLTGKVPGAIHAGSDENPAGGVRSVEEIRHRLDQALVGGLEPAMIGFEVAAIKDEAVQAALHGVDFSQLFIGLSFFILVSGIILTVLLIHFNLMQRSSQTGTMSALGFPAGSIFRLTLMENSITAVTGILLGTLLAIFYTKLVFNALEKVWFDIVRTSILTVHLEAGTILIGVLVSLLAALSTMVFSIRRLLRRQTATVQKQTASPGRKGNLLTGWILATLLTVISLILAILQFSREKILNPANFFVAGGLLLGALLLYTDTILKSTGRGQWIHVRLSSLRKRSLSFHRGRSMTIIILLALGTYLVISTGANRKDFSVLSGQKSSGTGGFLFYAESTVPLLYDLDEKKNRVEAGLMEEFSMVQFRVWEGDDASCLNLNRISNPRILAADPGELSGRFSFATTTDHLDPEDPWRSLDREIQGVIPAVADQTVIQWGLGKKVGDTLDYVSEVGEPLRLLLVGGLTPSVFQGNVIISERHFLAHFPSSSGTNVFLVEGEAENAEAISTDLQATFRDYGWEMTPTQVRLSQFYSVTNTYLAIFLVMGTFGMILGTVGLAILLVRNIRERRYEIALMAATGFSRKKIRSLISREYILLLVVGVVGGFITAVFSTLPVFLSGHSEVSMPFVGGLAALILVNGLIWIRILAGTRIRRLRITEDLRND
jgi:ABC-type antimicrobial peptide transport system permease subunit